MDATVAAGGVDVAGHVGGLRVLAERRASYAVPGALIERSALPLMPGRNSPAPISQSPSSAPWPSSRCFMQVANTSDTDSLSAPDWPS